MKNRATGGKTRRFGVGGGAGMGLDHGGGNGVEKESMGETHKRTTIEEKKVKNRGS